MFVDERIHAAMKETLPVSYLLFTARGRIDRLTYWNAQAFIWLSFYVLFNLLDLVFGRGATFVLYPPLYMALYCTAAKRLHDTNRTRWSLLLTAIPVLGPAWLFFVLGFRKGDPERNDYGMPPGRKEEYFVNPDATQNGHPKTSERIVNDVTRLNPVIVAEVHKPETIEQLQTIVKSTNRPISVGGGRFSMGGQTASPQSVHIDMRGLDRIEAFSEAQKLITVQAGARWCDIQRHIDPFDLSVKIMQSYANFTVGGSLSVNAHGRYMGLGPIILSVRSIDVMLADGSIVTATKDEHRELFYGAIGGYNALGIIVRATLELADNVRMKRVSRRLPVEEFVGYFNREVQNNPDAIMHNTDLYPPAYRRANAVTWSKTDEKVTTSTRLMPLKASYPIERYLLWAFTETPFGKWRREKIVEPLVNARKRVHWRNYEAGYDVAELEPKSRDRRTYALREYFVPVDRFDEFCGLMTEIFTRHRVNVINVSIRHTLPDPGSYLAWAREEMFASVVYYKQRTRANAKNRVAVWTREMIDAVLSVGGSYYLPYQIFATPEQFHRAYPRAKDLFQLKARYDPQNRFRNRLWDTYYQPKPSRKMVTTTSEFKSVMQTTTWSDKLYRFLQVVFHLYPEDRFHQLIVDACREHDTDEEIYRSVLEKLPGIKPFLSELTYALPALKKQKAEMSRQTLEILQDTRAIDGYLEIGSTGRYISHLKKHIPVAGSIYLQNDVAPGYGIGDFFERGHFGKIGTFLDLSYDPIAPEQIPSDSLSLVTLFIGFHHCPEEKLDAYLRSIHRVLKPGGKFIVREHDAGAEEMATFASLVHTVFNLGLKESWEFNNAEYRSFRSIDDWCAYAERFGFVDTKQRFLQDKDPSLNTLVCFIKESS